MGSILDQILAERFGVDRIKEISKDKVLSRVRRSIEAVKEELMGKGISCTLRRDGLIVRADGCRVACVMDRADPLAVSRIEASFSPEEMVVICWKASLSLIHLFDRKNLTLAILSRRQVLDRGTWFSELVIGSLAREGILLSEFTSLTDLKDERTFEEESEILLELNLLRERTVRVDPLQASRCLIDELRRMSERGTDELTMNRFLIALLELYPVEVDESSSISPGKPDIVSLSPLWILFELKNERATRRDVDQLLRYLEERRNEGEIPLPWRGVLVATDASVDTMTYAARRGVGFVSWRGLMDFMEEVFTSGLPVELMREAITGNMDSELKRISSRWNAEISLREKILELLMRRGALDEESILEELSRSLDGDLSMDELRSSLIEMSGPLLRLVSREGDLYLPPRVDPIPRAVRLLRCFGRRF